MVFLRSTAAIAIAVGLAGLAAGYGIARVRANAELAAVAASYRPLRLPEGTDSLTHRLYAYETPESTTLNEYRKLKDAINELITRKSDGATIKRTSVYFRNLDTGSWIGIDENATYHPASLLKVPLMIAYYKAAETDTGLLDEKIRFKSVTGGDPFEEQSSLVVGKTYTVRELIERMIVDSDNGATFTLFDKIDPKVLDDVYTDIGITKPDDSPYMISTKTYALFFRILFNATYLWPSHSEEGLQLLAKAAFKDGLVAGIPEGTITAHKFGEYVVSEDRKTPEGVEFHDCGIIYAPAHPYLLCVMTEAKTRERAVDLIKGISETTYEAVKDDF